MEAREKQEQYHGPKVLGMRARELCVQVKAEGLQAALATLEVHSTDAQLHRITTGGRGRHHLQARCEGHQQGHDLVPAFLWARWLMRREQ